MMEALSIASWLIVQFGIVLLFFSPFYAIYLIICWVGTKFQKIRITKFSINRLTDEPTITFTLNKLDFKITDDLKKQIEHLLKRHRWETK
jgi:hypothetical protein